MITKERALELLNKHLKNENLKKHCIASGAIMKALAKHFNKPEEEWEVAGILHDIDLDITRDNPKEHALKALDILKDEDIKEEYLKAIAAHNEENGSKRTTLLDHALAAAESITGLIVACALVYPDKKISSVKVKSIKKRMKEKSFARTVSRENIKECELINLPLEEFISVSLKAMAEIENVLMG